MTNILSRLAGGFGRGVEALGTLGISEFGIRNRQARELQEEERRRAIAQILSGQSTPAFLREGGAEGTTPEQRRGSQLRELANVPGQQAFDLVKELAPLTREAPTPLSPAAKIEADVAAGRLTPQVGQQLIQRATEPRRPLVEVSTGAKAETEGQKILSKAAATRITGAQEAGNAASDIDFSADRIQQAINRGSTGTLSNLKTIGVELLESINIPVSQEELDKAKDVRAVNKIFSEGALTKLESLKGSTSNKDLQFAKEIAGRVTEGKGALQEIVDLMKASSVKATQIAEIANQGIADGLKTNEIDRLVSQARKRIRLSTIFDDVISQRESQQPVDERDKAALERGFTPEEIQDFKRRRGIQ